MKERYELILYVIGPYRNSSNNYIFDNIIRARTVAKALWDMGFTVHCPHTNSMFMDDRVPTDEVFLLGGLEVLSRCDAVVMIPGWDNSSGSLEERDLAWKLNIPVFYWEEDNLGELIDWSDNKCLTSRSPQSKSEITVSAKVSKGSMNLPLVLGSMAFFTLSWLIGTRWLSSRERDDSAPIWF